jgi:hypothetical protein
MNQSWRHRGLDSIEILRITAVVLPMLALALGAPTAGAQGADRERAARRVSELGGSIRLSKDPITNQTYVAEVDLSGRPLTDEDLSIITAFNRLEVLGLGGTNITSRGMSSVSRLVNLQRLDLSRTKIGDKAMGMLTTLIKLREINLRDTPIGDRGIAWLRGMSSEGVFALASADAADKFMAEGNGEPSAATRSEPQGKLEDRGWWLNNPVRLDLSGTRITDAGVISLTRDLPWIVELSLARTDVTDVALDHLSILHDLESLDIRGTKISKDQLHRLYSRGRYYYQLNKPYKLKRLKTDHTDYSGKALVHLVVEWEKRRRDEVRAEEDKTERERERAQAEATQRLREFKAAIEKAAREFRAKRPLKIGGEPGKLKNLSVGEVVHVLKTGAMVDRISACEYLERLGPRAGQDAARALAEAAEVPAWPLSAFATLALARVDPSSLRPAHRIVLIVALTEDDGWLSQAAQTALKRLPGHDDQTVLSLFVSAVRDDQPAVRDAAQATLEAIAANAPKSFSDDVISELLRFAINAEGPIVQKFDNEIIRKVRPQAAEILNLVRELPLEEAGYTKPGREGRLGAPARDAKEVAAGIRKLGEFGELGRVAVPELSLILDHPNPVIWEAADDTLEKILGRTNAYVSLMRRLAASSDDAKVLHAFNRLVKCGDLKAIGLKRREGWNSVLTLFELPADERAKIIRETFTQDRPQPSVFPQPLGR